MEVIPAIDLRGGRCVRLYQGDYSRETVFSEDPVAVALRWEGLGAPRLHLVDLDGAAEGVPVNLKVVQRIAEAVQIPCQLGGGIRALETIEQVLALGVKRVILGTVALEGPELVRKACAGFGEAIVVGVDARQGKVATRGWLRQSSRTAIEVVREMAEAGVRRFIYTDISRDGTLTEPDFQSTGDLVSSTGACIIASGGVASVEHLLRLAGLGVEGAIVGRALYTGDVDLAQAIASMCEDSRERASEC